MKSILEQSDQNVPKIHSVNKLYALITKNTDFTLPVTEDELDLIDDIYIDTRYPGNFGLLPSGFPEKDDAELLYNIAEKVYNSTIQYLKRKSN